MPLLDASVFSKALFGETSNTQSVSRRLSLLDKLEVINPNTKRVSLNEVNELVVFYRILYFSIADFQMLRNESVSGVLNYANPCNLRKAYHAVIAYLTENGYASELSEVLKEVDLLFRPNESHSRSATDDLSGSTMLEGQQRVYLTSGSNGYSLVARTDISPNTVVLSLDEHVPISVFSAFRDSKFPSTDLYEQGMHPDSIFLVYLVYLRSVQATLPVKEHVDFFKVQPTTYGTLYEFPAELIEALQDADILESIATENNMLRELSLALQPSFSYDYLLWAKSLCASRGFSLPVQPQSELEKDILTEFYSSGKVTTLLPTVHFFNHDFYGRCDFPVMHANGSVSVKAFSSISKGEEIFINYGGFNNKQLMLNYGFYIPNNPYDSIHYTVGTSQRPFKFENFSRFDHIEDSIQKDLIIGYLKDRNQYCL